MDPIDPTNHTHTPHPQSYQRAHALDHKVGSLGGHKVGERHARDTRAQQLAAAQQLLLQLAHGGVVHAQQALGVGTGTEAA